jgi:hypothetical protein
MDAGSRSRSRSRRRSKGTANPAAGGKDSSSDSEPGARRGEGVTGPIKVPNTLARFFGAPEKPAGDPDDPTYKQIREPFLPWPQVLTTSKGKLKDLKVNKNAGWGLHFKHPERPYAKPHMKDLEAVLDHLRATQGFCYAKIKEEVHGIVQVDMGETRSLKMGNLQLYHARFNRSTGNVRISSGDPERVKTIRNYLVRSAWFLAAGLDAMKVTGPLPHLLRKDHKLLPVLPSNFPKENLRQMLQDVAEGLGAEGKKAVRAYVNSCKAPGAGGGDWTGVLDAVLGPEATK